MITPFQHTSNRLPFSNVVPLNPLMGHSRVVPKIAIPTANSNSGHKAPDLPRGLNFYADYSGCGHWRMIWPEFNYIKWLKQLSKEFDFKIIYEIDDLIFKEDIPYYNKFRFAFEDPTIRKTSMEIMQHCDEITVTNKFMKEYYIEKTKNQNVTILPNFIPKFWMDRFFDFNKIRDNFEKNKRKPRVVYCGSGAHFDIENKIKQRDDFYHVNDVIRKTVDKFQWVFVGGFPLTLRDLVSSKKIEYHEWSNLVEYPSYIDSMNVTLIKQKVI